MQFGLDRIMSGRAVVEEETSKTGDEPVLRNGRTERSREQKVAYWIGGISGFYLLSLFLVPALLPTGSIPELSGRANSLDYYNDDSWGNNNWQEGGSLGHNQSAHGGSFAWSELNPYAAFIYGFGDFNCHQKYERSWFINGNQMAVCSRDIGIFAGLTLAALAFWRFGHNRWTVRDTFLTLFPDQWVEPLYLNDKRMLAMLGIGFCFVIPLILDGGIQAITSYESNNFLRLVTGLPFGFIIGWWFSASLSSRPHLFDNDPRKVMLPAGATLITDPDELASAKAQKS